jgi:hypothetical protein
MTVNDLIKKLHGLSGAEMQKDTVIRIECGGLVEKSPCEHAYIEEDSEGYVFFILSGKAQ